MGGDSWRNWFLIPHLTVYELEDSDVTFLSFLTYLTLGWSRPRVLDVYFHVDIHSKNDALPAQAFTKLQNLRVDATRLDRDQVPLVATYLDRISPQDCFVDVGEYKKGRIRTSGNSYRKLYVV